MREDKRVKIIKKLNLMLFYIGCIKYKIANRLDLDRKDKIILDSINKATEGVKEDVHTSKYVKSKL